MLELSGVTFRYGEEGCGSVRDAVGNVSLTIAAGEFVALLGVNGSGKSTLGKLMNGLLLPQSGSVCVDGLTICSENDLWEVRRRVGMVFQDPGRQMVASVVEDEVAFGPENLGIEPKEIRRRMDKVFARLELDDLRLCCPNMLSGGQKQRVAIASVLVMEPRYVVMDEPTAMLDPVARREVLHFIQMMRDDLGLGVVYITHHMEEAMAADRVVVMSGGRICREGRPTELFRHTADLAAMGLSVPPLVELAERLRAGGIALRQDCYGVRGLGEAILELVKPPFAAGDSSAIEEAPVASVDGNCIEVSDITYRYSRGTPFERQALRGASLAVRPGECIGLVGSTGSGKSTLAQHLNGLLRADTGRVRVCGVDIGADVRGNIGNVRFEVGLLFQFPEQQLFEESVFEDVAFGPRNMGLPEDGVKERVREALDMVGLAMDVYGERSPFALSGGEKRRAALAGVLAMHPQCLVLDEPTAGLDPRAANDLLKLLQALNRERGLTMVVISHRFDELAKLAKRIVVMSGGKVVADGSVRSILSDVAQLEKYGLEAPCLSRFFDYLAHNGLVFACQPLSVDEAQACLTQTIFREFLQK